MEKVTNIEEYKTKKQELLSEDENLNLARKNGYSNFEDYNYSIAKEFAVNPNFSLNREYYDQMQRYLKNTLINFLLLKKSNYIKEGNEITVYALNELISALYKNNEELIGILDREGLSVNDFLKLIYSTTLEKVSENNLGLKRGM